MRRSVSTVLFGLIALASGGAEPVGVKIDAVAVPASAVTVPLEQVTVSQEQVTVAESAMTALADSEKLRRELIDEVRGASSEDVRLKALSRLWEQDDVFYLFFKPGTDRNPAIRAAAIRSLAEVEVVKALGEKSGVPEVSKAASDRLSATYADAKDQKPVQGSSVVRQYARRMKARSR